MVKLIAAKPLAGLDSIRTPLDILKEQVDKLSRQQDVMNRQLIIILGLVEQRCKDASKAKPKQIHEGNDSFLRKHKKKDSGHMVVEEKRKNVKKRDRKPEQLSPAKVPKLTADTTTPAEASPPSTHTASAAVNAEAAHAGDLAPCAAHFSNTSSTRLRVVDCCDLNDNVSVSDLSSRSSDSEDTESEQDEEYNRVCEKIEYSLRHYFPGLFKT